MQKDFVYAGYTNESNTNAQNFSFRNLLFLSKHFQLIITSFTYHLTKDNSFQPETNRLAFKLMGDNQQLGI